MRKLRYLVRSLFTSSRHKQGRYHRAISLLADQIMTLRHEFLQCQGSLLSAIWHDPPSLFAEHLDQTQGRLVKLKQRLESVLARVEHRREETGKHLVRTTLHHGEIIRELEQRHQFSMRGANTLFTDIEQLIVLTRYLAKGGDRNTAADLLAKVADHYAPTPPPRGASLPYREGPVHRAGFGLIVEAIPESEWERYASASGRLVKWTPPFGPPVRSSKL